MLESRKDEIAALALLNPALAQTKELINAAADAAKSRSLDIQLAEAKGDTNTADAMKHQDILKTLSPADQMKQISIWFFEAMKKVADDAKKIQDTLDAGYKSQQDEIDSLTKASMSLSDQRDLELSKLDAHGKELQKEIYRLQDLATATDLAKKAQDELDNTYKALRGQITTLEKANMSVVDQRKLELSLLDSTGQALQQRIYDLQDEATAVAAQKTAQDALNATYNGIQGEIDALVKSSMTLQQQRELELSTLDATARALKLRLYALQDEAAAKVNSKAADDAYMAAAKTRADKFAQIEQQRLTLNIQVMELEGRSAQALAEKRRIELAAMDSSLQPIQEHIYALQDEQAAAKAASEAADKLAADLQAQAEAAKKLSNDRYDLETQLIEAQGNSLEVLNRNRQKEIETTDNSLIDLKRQVWAEQDLAAVRAKAADVAKQQRSLDIQLMDATGDAAGALATKRYDELLALDGSLRGTQVAIWAALDAKSLADKAQAASDTANKAHIDAVTKARDVLTNSYNKEKSALTDTQSKFQAFAKSLSDFKNSLLAGSLSTLSPEQKYNLALQDFQDTSAKARSGDETSIGRLQEVSQAFLDASRGFNASTTSYTNDFRLVQQALTDVAQLSQNKADVATRQLAILERQVQGLIAINNTELSVLAAITALQQAVQAAPEGTPYYLNGSHADGLDYVPFDGYKAELHKGERVQTAKAAKADDDSKQDMKEMNAGIKALCNNINPQDAKAILLELMKMNRKLDDVANSNRLNNSQRPKA